MKIKNVIFYISFLLISSIVSLTPLLANEDAKGVVKERMDNFKMSKKMMQTIHKSIQNEDFVTIEKSATTLHNWSKEMIKYFPEGSDGAPSKASADIWLDLDGFKKAVNNFELASLKLINNPDILRSMSFGKYKPKVTVGFAYETNDVFQNAKKKLLSKNCDYLVLNFPTTKDKIFNSKYNNGILIGRSGDFLNLGNVSKTIFANKIVKYISNRKN